MQNVGWVGRRREAFNKSRRLRKEPIRLIKLDNCRRLVRRRNSINQGGRDS